MLTGNFVYFGNAKEEIEPEHIMANGGAADGQIGNQQKAYEGHAKDHEFSGTSMREHWQSGREDTRRTLKRQ